MFGPLFAACAAFTTPVVVCPGFGNDASDYVTPLQQPEEKGLVSALKRRGATSVSIMPVQRSDWARVAGGLLDIGFYRGDAKPTGGGYGWYVQRLKSAVDEAYEASGGERVLLIGHSAGGWLARAALGDGEWAPGVRSAERVCCLATIGAIHRPPSDPSACVTRGALAYVDSEYPGAYLAAEGIGYVSVGGDAIVGCPTRGPQEAPTQADALYAKRGEGSAARVAYRSYSSVCGDGDVTGDGVVPLDWTQLQGARQLRLDGVLHSINEAGTTLPTDRWYGSEAVVDRWLGAALREAGVRTGLGGRPFEAAIEWAQELAKTLAPASPGPS